MGFSMTARSGRVRNSSPNGSTVGQHDLEGIHSKGRNGVPGCIVETRIQQCAFRSRDRVFADGSCSVLRLFRIFLIDGQSLVSMQA